MRLPEEDAETCCVHAVAEILASLRRALRDILKKPPSESLLLDNYARLCLIVDEMIFEVRS